MQISRNAKACIMLDFLEEGTTQTLDDSVVDMSLSEDQFLDYYLKALKTERKRKELIGKAFESLSIGGLLLSLISGEAILLLW